jgi:hypothetical protein
MIKKRKVKHSTPTKKKEVYVSLPMKIAVEPKTRADKGIRARQANHSHKTEVSSVKPSKTSLSFREVDSAALPHPFLPV